MMTFEQFLETYKVGKSYGYEWTYIGECVSLVKCYIRDVLGGKPQRIGDAKDYWGKREGNYIQSLFTPIANTPEFVPQKGDVFVRTSGEKGHVGIVISATAKEFNTIEQNNGGCRVVKRIKHTEWENYNFLRPKNQVNIMPYIIVFLLGNSYTYYNGYGELLSKLCKAANINNVIVVRATKGGVSANKLLTDKLEYKAWLNGKVIASGKNTLENIKRIDFNSIGRAGKWDYIVLQNNATVDGTYKYDVQAFKALSSLVPKPTHFILNCTHFGDKITDERLKQHQKAAKDCGCSLIDERGIIGKYSTVFAGQNWKTELTIQDKPNFHASVRGMYLNATATFAKIFGFAKLPNNTAAPGIPLYNADDKSAKGSLVNDKWHKGSTRGNSVTKSVAAKLQYLVKANAAYIGTPLNCTAPTVSTTTAAKPTAQAAVKQPSSKPTTTVKKPTVKYFKKYTGTSVSIADALKSVCGNGTYAYRKKVAKANGIKGYLGRPKQNKKMLALLKAGKLIKP